jgi:hypothetical protein
MKIRLFVCLAALLLLIACATQTDFQAEVADTPAAQPTDVPPTAQPVEPTPSAESLIMLRDPLDEPEFYCIDMVGFGSNLNLNAPLQAHTCKPGADDELFIFNHPAAGQFFMEAYDVCLEAGDGQLFVKECSDSPNQQFTLSDDGILKLESAELCVAVQSGDGQPAGGRSHVRRDLLVQNCGEVEQSLSRWTLPGPRP